MTKPDIGPSTRAVHGGEPRDNPYHGLPTPLVQTATYRFANTAELVAYMEERMFWDSPQRYDYARYGNPTVQVAEKKLAELEGGDDAVLFASGMAALTHTLLMFLNMGDHIVVTDDCYRRTRQFVKTFLPRMNVSATVVAAGDYAAMEAAITPQTRILFSETPTNPFLRILDLERVAAIARRHNIRTMLDSTFGSPINLRPLDMGIDLVMHSASKYLNGHNDLLGGVVIGKGGITQPLREALAMFGPVMDPQGAHLLLRGLKTLAPRVKWQNDSALRIAQFLEQHPKVARVWYPGLPSHSDHALACQQMTGFGGVISFELAADGATTGRFIDALTIPIIAPSLGGVESLIEQPALMSYFETDKEVRLSLGIKDELVRLSVGIEDVDDLLADLRQALDEI